MLSCPDCPKDSLELEDLLLTLGDTTFSLTPEEYKKRYEEQKNIHGNIIKLALSYFPNEFEGYYKQVIKWGETFDLAVEHFRIHLNGEGREGGCQMCNSNYDEFRKRKVEEFARERGIDMNDKKSTELLEIEVDVLYRP